MTVPRKIQKKEIILVDFNSVVSKENDAYSDHDQKIMAKVLYIHNRRLHCKIKACDLNGYHQSEIISWGTQYGPYARKFMGLSMMTTDVKGPFKIDGPSQESLSSRTP